ncbi:hypothetical protein Stsp01_27610 [Streptomyces sp. NBRC 13847]|nr:hypothetical protein Stsp01_27610 [Streptomyces sp. NBRC 13847]
MMTADAWLRTVPIPAKVTAVASDAADKPLCYGVSELTKARNRSRRS